MPHHESQRINVCSAHDKEKYREKERQKYTLKSYGYEEKKPHELLSEPH